MQPPRFVLAHISTDVMTPVPLAVFALTTMVKRAAFVVPLSLAVDPMSIDIRDCL